MNSFTRRDFLRGLATASAFLLGGNSLSPAFASPDEIKRFEVLVAGDSITWGQGLQEKDKFYTLIKDWLQNDLFGKTASVGLKVKAHSGARIYLHEDEAREIEDAEIDTSRQFYQEVNFSFPTIINQIDQAKSEYEDPADVRLIILSAGITNVTIGGILNPFGDEKRLRESIHKNCNGNLYLLLKRSADAFPNAKILLLGYYPMISKQSDKGQVLKAILELYDVPQPLKALLSNPVSKQFLKGIRNKMVKRSRIWAQESEGEMLRAIEKLNTELASERAVYLKSPVTEETCYATKNSLLWGMTKKGKAADDLYEKRKIECDSSIDELREDTKLKLSKRFCSLAGVGHPNVEGAKAYAETIKENLKKTLVAANL